MIGVIDCGVGNLSSVKNALDFIGAESIIIKDPNLVKSVDKLLLPGVGSFKVAMDSLTAEGFVSEIQNFADTGKYILGICLGMQLLAETGYESGITKGLGLIKGKVELFKSISLRIPHMGWNGIKLNNEHPILNNVKLKADFYFVHSYFFNTSSVNNILTYTDYGSEFPSIVCNDRKNVIGIQFHPEKSQKQGIKILQNFLSL